MFVRVYECVSVYRPVGGLLHPVHGPRLSQTLANFTQALRKVIQSEYSEFYITEQNGERTEWLNGT